MKKLLLSVAKVDGSFLLMKERLSCYCKVDICDLENYSLKGYDFFVGKKMKLEKLEEADKLKCIFVYKTGVDDFPLEELEKRKITLINSHANASKIGEYAFALATSLVFHINKYDNDLRKTVWYDKKDYYWQSIFDLKVGLLGYGRIGKSIHQILKKNNIESYTIKRSGIYQDINLVNNLNELIKSCDVIISSLPSTKETNNLFNRETFSMMKDKYLVNVGRANLIDEEALFEALVSGGLKGAAIDTWKQKPKDINTTLKVSTYDFENLHNVILSPHAAMRTKEGHHNYVMDVTDKIINYINNNVVSDVVDLTKGY